MGSTGRIKLFFSYWILAAFFSLLFLFCTRPEEFTGDKFRVMVSILPYADFVKKVGRDRVDVMVMIPPGASPATYEPTARQMAALESARLYIKVGSGLPFEEAWLDKIISSARDMVLVDASGGITIHGRDPHIWLSPRLAKQQVRNICRGLIRIDPDGRGFYEGNRDAFLSELESLDREIRKEFSGLADAQFMIFHPSFGYFAEDYGLRQVPIEIEGKEPGPRNLVRLIDEAKAKDVKVIFVAPQFSTKQAEVIARGIGGRVEFVDPLARDYVANLRNVTKSLKEGLEGK